MELVVSIRVIICVVIICVVIIYVVSCCVDITEILFRDIADDIARYLCRGWYTKDELGMVCVGDSWIESS